MSLKRTAISGMVWTFTQQFGSQAISFVVSIFLARILLPAEFGLIGMITVFIALGQSLVDSGLTQSLIRTKNAEQIDYSTVFFFNLAGSVIIYLLMYIAAPLIAAFYNQEILTNILRVLCFSFIIRAFSAVQLTRLTKQMNFKSQMVIALPSLLISGVLGIYLAKNGYGPWSLVWMQLCQHSLNSVQLWLKSKWYPSFEFSWPIFNKHFSFGYKLMFSGLLDTFFSNIYQIIIGKYFIPSQVGFYTRANSLKQLPVTNFSNALNKVTYPLFATIQNDNIRLKAAYKQVMKLVIFIIAPILVTLAGLAEPLIRLLFTEKWLPSVPYFQVLCIAGLLYPIHSYNLNILKVKGRSDLFLKLEIVKKILIILTVAFSIRYGIMGLVWGQVIISILSFFLNTHYTGKFLSYSSYEQARDILPAILLSFIVGYAVITFDTLLEINGFSDLVRMSVGLTGGGLIYVVIAVMFNMSSISSIKSIILKR